MNIPSKNRTYKIAGISLGIAVVGMGLVMTSASSPVMAESAATLANPHHVGVPAPQTFHTNHLPIPAVAKRIPAGPLPASVTISRGKARTIAIQWIEWHRPTKKIVPPVITGITLMSRSAVEQQAGSQSGLPPYLWKVTFRSTDFELFGHWPQGSVYINTETGFVPVAHGAPNS